MPKATLALGNYLLDNPNTKIKEICISGMLHVDINFLAKIRNIETLSVVDCSFGVFTEALLGCFLQLKKLQLSWNYMCPDTATAMANAIVFTLVPKSPHCDAKHPHLCNPRLVTALVQSPQIEGGKST